MEQEYSQTTNTVDDQKEKKRFIDSYWLNIILFIITFITTLLAGMFWTTGSMGPYEFDSLKRALPYTISILFVLACHEFGHYYAAKYHKVKATLPYFIPFPPIPIFINFGTMGAVIKTKSPVQNNKSMFDIGVSGPIAGFIACIFLLVYGFTNLPGIDYILSIHPDFLSPAYGKDAIHLEFGDTFLFAIMRSLLTRPDQFIPPMSEIYHYPYLCVGWFGLFVTAMNMIPVGQLDGGHIVYSMFGETKHEAIASISMILLAVLGFLGLVESFVHVNFGIGWSGWLFWAFVLFFVIKIKHPPVPHFEPLNFGRMFIGYISLAILFLSFSPTPLIIYIR